MEVTKFMQNINKPLRCHRKKLQKIKPALRSLKYYIKVVPMSIVHNIDNNVHKIPMRKGHR